MEVPRNDLCNHDNSVRPCGLRPGGCAAGASGRRAGPASRGSAAIRGPNAQDQLPGRLE
jgi:hypothetical protein